MLISLPYDRQRAVEYARRWALSRNPLFPDFAGVGGDCTNFVSQCILAGCSITNDTPTFGWYYRSEADRAPAWSGVDELYRFLTGAEDFRAENGGVGPYATDAARSGQIMAGDVIQLSDARGEFYHTLIISDITDDEIYVCAHTNDVLDRPLSTYRYGGLRVLHIEGANLFYDRTPAFTDLQNATAIRTLRTVID